MKYYVGLLIAALTIVSALVQGVLVPAFWAPDIVCDEVEASTSFGPRVQEQMSRILTRHVFQSMLESTPPQTPKVHGKPADNAGQMMDMLTKMAKNTLKKQLNPETLFPDNYYRLTIRNDGLRPTQAMRLVLRIPGVIVDRKMTCPTRPSLDATPIKILDDTVPIGLTMGPSELLPQESMTLEVWYAKGHIDPSIAPDDWPSAVTAYVLYERGSAKRAGTGYRPWVIPGLTALAGLLLLSTAFTSVAWRIAVRRGRQAPTSPPPAADGSTEPAEPEEPDPPPVGTPGW